MANSIEVLSDDVLAAVVAGTDVHGEVRKRSGMCGCGVLPDPGSLHLH